MLVAALIPICDVGKNACPIVKNDKNACPIGEGMGGQQLSLNVESERRSGKLQRNDASASNANPGEATLPGAERSCSESMRGFTSCKSGDGAVGSA